MVGPLRKGAAHVARDIVSKGGEGGIERTLLPIASAVSSVAKFRIPFHPHTTRPLTANRQVARSPSLLIASRVGLAARSVLATMTSDPVADRAQDPSEPRRVLSDFQDVRDMARHLQSHHHCAVIEGPPGSGKSEKEEVACGRPPETFDLKQEYYNHLKDEKIKETETALGRPLMKAEVRSLDDKLWAEFDKTYETTGKAGELVWLKGNYEQLRDRLIEQENPIVALDEIDLIKGDLVGPGLESALIMIHLAQELRDAGKSAVIILHPQGVASDQLVGEMKTAGLIDGKGDITTTKFLSEKEQLEACKAMGFSDDDAKKAVFFTQGVPGAYLEFFKKAAKNESYTPTYDEFIAKAREKLGRNVGVIQRNSSASVKTILKVLMNNHSLTRKDFEKIVTENGGKPQDIERELLDSGLVYMDGTSFAVPEAVRVASLQPQYQESLAAVTIYDTTQPGNPTLTSERSDTSPKGLSHRLALRFLAEHCGGGRVLGAPADDVPSLIIPSSLGRLSARHHHDRMRISGALGIVGRLPEERSYSEHADWRNSARSVDELMRNAHAVRDSFLSVVQSASRNVGEVHTGPRNKFLIKDRISVERKLRSWSKSGSIDERNLAVLNDTIRATIIVPDVIGNRTVVNQFFATATANGWKVVFSDKYDNIYPSGYVGVHAKVLIPVEGGGYHMGEVQFHLRAIHDGTASSTKEESHRIMDSYARILDNEEKRPSFVAGVASSWGIAPERMETKQGVERILMPIVNAAQKVLYTAALAEMVQPPIISVPGVRTRHMA